MCDANFHPQAENIIYNNLVWIYPIDNNGEEKKWRYARQSVESVKHLLRARKTNNKWQIEKADNKW